MGKSNLNFSEEIGGRDFARKTGMKAALLEGGSPACFRPTEPLGEHFVAHYQLTKKAKQLQRHHSFNIRLADIESKCDSKI